MAFLKTEAIVIKATDFKEADKIITFFSQDYGKIQGIARGIRKIRTKYSGKLELFTRIKVIFFQKREHLHSEGFPDIHPLLPITQVDVIEVFPQLTADFHKLIGASYLAEFLNRLFEPYDASHQPVYGLVCHTLRTLDASQNIRAILPAFEIKFLAHLGYAPVLDHCVLCHRPRSRTARAPSVPLSPAMMPGFSFSSGGVLCQRCKQLRKDMLELTPLAVETLQQLFETDMRHIEEIPVSPALLNELRLLLKKYLQYHLGISLKTDTFVQKLKSTRLPH